MLAPKWILLSRIGFFSFLLFVSFQVFPQNITVKGTVINSGDSTPLAGVSVTELKTKKGVAANDQGFFSFQTPTKNPVIMISRIGFQSTTIVRSPGSTSILSLEPNTSGMQDMVVVG